MYKTVQIIFFLSKVTDVEFRLLSINGSVTLLLEKKAGLQEHKERERGEKKTWRNSRKTFPWSERLDHACFRNFRNCRLGVDRQNSIFTFIFFGGNLPLNIHLSLSYLQNDIAFLTSPYFLNRFPSIHPSDREYVYILSKNKREIE